jgi:hypothetical protein
VRDDVASPAERLYKFSRPLTIALMNEARTFENGLHASFEFRSLSEQEKLRDPEWD